MRCWSYMHSFVACVVVMYLTSTVDKVTSFCFFKLQDTMPPSIRNMYPEMA